MKETEPMRPESVVVLRDWIGRRRSPPGETGLDLRPGTAYEAVTRQMVETLAEELKEIKGRLNGIIFMIGGAMVIDVIGRWMIMR